jgi:hypothetical protein
MTEFANDRLMLRTTGTEPNKIKLSCPNALIGHPFFWILAS